MSVLHKLEKKLHSDELFKHVLDNLADGVTIQDREYTIIYQNRVLLEIFGNCVGKKCYDIYEKKSNVCEDCGIRDAFETGAKSTVIRTPIVAGGFRENVCFPLFDNAGEIIAGVEICRDISDRAQLEVAVKDRNVKLGQLNQEITRQAAQQEKMLEDLREAQDNLIRVSHAAGMAEVATNILHNVGNLLNSAMVTAELIDETLKNSEIKGLSRAAALLHRNPGNLATFLTEDKQGKLLPDYLRTLAAALEDEHVLNAERLTNLFRKLEQIGRIVSFQQNYANNEGISETCTVEDIVDDALRIFEEDLRRGRIELIRQIDPMPKMILYKQKVIQILVHLFSNAMQAVSDPSITTREITVRIPRPSRNYFCLSVEDSGVGIPPPDLQQVFQYGFSTRADGHGVGLHWAANAARELGGTLTAHSDGVGRGAMFVLEIPTKLTEKTLE